MMFQHGLMSHTLQLAHNCLTFDFIGTSLDETSDDLSTVQIPTSWRSGRDDCSYVIVFLVPGVGKSNQKQQFWET